MFPKKKNNKLPPKRKSSFCSFPHFGIRKDALAACFFYNSVYFGRAYVFCKRVDDTQEDKATSLPPNSPPCSRSSPLLSLFRTISIAPIFPRRRKEKKTQNGVKVSKKLQRTFGKCTKKIVFFSQFVLMSFIIQRIGFMCAG